MDKDQSAHLAKVILAQFWLSQVDRVAQSRIRDDREDGVLLVPPTKAQYAQAAELIEQATADPVSSLAVAE